MGRSSKPQKVKKGNLRAALTHYANAAKRNKPGKRSSKKGKGIGASAAAAAAAAAAAPKAELHCALRSVFMGLGEEKWREHVDRVDQAHGQLVYDQCLHGGNGGGKEPGYMRNCEVAWNCERPKTHQPPRESATSARPTPRPRAAPITFE